MSDVAGSVLITRPRPAADETARRVAALGLRPIVAPLLMIHRLPARLPADAMAILVTSGNAVESLPDWARDRPVFAVGDATAAHAHALGFKQVHSAGGSAADLASLVYRTLPAQPRGDLLLLTGKGQGTTLAELLRARGHEVSIREVYEAAAVAALPETADAALRGGRLKAALFFSAETARVFVRLVVEAQLRASVEDTDAGAISKAAGMALEALPWRRIRIAARPTQDAMLALLR